MKFFAEVLARREDMEVETCGSGVDTTVGANSGPEDQDKPAQGSPPIGMNRFEIYKRFSVSLICQRCSNHIQLSFPELE